MLAVRAGLVFLKPFSQAFVMENMLADDDFSYGIRAKFL
jgi:hypothetical protein